VNLTAADVLAARRELASRSLANFARLVDIPTVPPDEEPDDAEPDAYPTRRFAHLADHHKLLCDALDQVEAKAYNLMVLMPPGSAKSTYVDVVWIPRLLARKPRRQVILGSYASGIARKQGRRARQLINSPSFRELHPGITLAPDQRAMDEWALSNGSEFMSGGLLSGLTGNRADYGVIDDPIKGRQEAESDITVETTWEAYLDDFCSRLKPGATQVMVLTRWSERDPAGRILPEGWDGESGMFDGRDGRRWRVICLPAVADRADDPLGRKIGEGLWPEWFPPSHWEPFRRNPRTWASLYQQKPRAQEGTFFQRAWFKRYKPADKPEFLHVYMTSDHANTEDGGDWSVFRVWGVDPHGAIYMLGGFRCQSTTDKAMGVRLDDKTGEMSLLPEGGLPLVRRFKPLCWFPENDATWKSVAPFARAAMRATGTHCRIEPLTTAGGDKAVKAQAFQAKAAMGMVYLPEGPEGDEVLNEYVGFPGAKHDDEVDAAAHMGRALDEAHPAIVIPKAADRPRDLWGREDTSGESWKTA